MYRHEHHDCFCKKICDVVKLILAGTIFGAVATMVGMYFFENDKCMQRQAKRMLQSAEDFTHNIKSKIE